MTSPFLDYYRCGSEYAAIEIDGELAPESGFFRFGPDLICFGRLAKGRSDGRADGDGDDVYGYAGRAGGVTTLPFDYAQVVNDLRLERYLRSAETPGGMMRRSWVRRAYYFVRPLLPVSMRKHLQRAALRGWESIPFPSWPVDTTVDRLMEKLMRLALAAHCEERIPFVWFWPDGYPSCTVITHDVEAVPGRDFCPTLMDINDSFGIKSSFQLVPEHRYEIDDSLLELMRGRGFEIGIHGLNHDGHLFEDREEFLRRAVRINEYGKQLGAVGFRSPVLYRRADWFDALSFDYDMTIPAVAHLDPQRGGCCTVMPYFIGDLLELPLTTTQDYTLFNVLKDYSIDLWAEQIAQIRQRHGLISFNIHPDYLIEQRAQQTYRSLLEHLDKIRSDRGTWITLPRALNDWWRQRSRMSLRHDGDGWRIEGSGSARARLAFARSTEAGIHYELEGGEVLTEMDRG